MAKVKPMSRRKTHQPWCLRSGWLRQALAAGSLSG